MARPKQPALSIVLAVFNEASRLGKTLDAVKDMQAELVIVDGGSTDTTIRIARSYGARVITAVNSPMFHTNKQMAIDAARGKWILQLDADEIVDQPLKASIQAIITEGSGYTAFYVKRKNYFLGRFLTKGGQYPDPVIRFFKKGQAHLPQQDIHEQLQVQGDTGTLTGHLLHYNAPTFARYLDNFNRYTSFRAGQLEVQGVGLNLKNDVNFLLVKPVVTFCRLFWRHRGYVDGFPGFAFALFSGLFHAVSYMKLGDLKREQATYASGH